MCITIIGVVCRICVYIQYNCVYYCDTYTESMTLRRAAVAHYGDKVCHMNVCYNNRRRMPYAVMPYMCVYSYYCDTIVSIIVIHIRRVCPYVGQPFCTMGIRYVSVYVYHNNRRL
jgi:hypothetical protein